MQTAFTEAQLRVPEFADAKKILTDCVHYGFCTADELDAPRGRIDLIHEMLEAGGAPSARTVGYIDRCLSCNACMSTCAAKVDYMHLADIRADDHRTRPIEMAARRRQCLVHAGHAHVRKDRQ